MRSSVGGAVLLSLHGLLLVNATATAKAQQKNKKTKKKKKTKQFNFYNKIARMQCPVRELNV